MKIDILSASISFHKDRHSELPVDIDIKEVFIHIKALEDYGNGYRVKGLYLLIMPKE